jgi:hypothetical protein
MDGVRRSVAETIAPPRRSGRADPLRDEPTRPARADGEVDARFDAARERLRSSVAPRDEEDDEA